MINIHNSYFSVGNPLQILDKWFNPPRHSKTVTLRDKPVEVEWTRRAQRALESRDNPLIVEMQLYFSCVVKKRVLFHDSYDLETVTVNNDITVAFRTVESTSCDPIEFAENFPIKQEFESKAASKMRPKHLLVDYVDDNWVGEYRI